MGEWYQLRDECPILATEWKARDVLVNSPGHPVLGEELIRSIASARHSVIAINPLLTDARMIDTLVAARKRRVSVKLITELREYRRSGIEYPTRGFEAETATNLEEHFRIVRVLAQERVLCRGLRHYAHGKAVVVDDQQVILSSANWTANSLGWGSQPSLEAGVSIWDPPIVSAWGNALCRLWDSCPFRLHSLDNDVSLQEEPSPAVPIGELDRLCLDSVQMSWSYPPEHYGIRDQLVDLVRRATQSIVFSALSFYDTERIPILQQALEEALARGVSVTVVVRPGQFLADRYPDPSTRRLLERGLLLRGVEGLHAKWIAVDGTVCGLFSANVNPFSLQSNAESAHVECGLFVSPNYPLLEAYCQFIEELNRQATHAYRN